MLWVINHCDSFALQDISEIVSSRLAAMKKLQENPNDPEALAAMYEAQKQMSNWAASKNKPGQFTGEGKYQH